MASLTLNEVAARLGVKQTRAKLLLQTGRIKARKHGIAWLVEEEDLKAFQALPPLKPGRKKKS